MLNRSRRYHRGKGLNNELDHLNGILGDLEKTLVIDNFSFDETFFFFSYHIAIRLSLKI